MDSLVEVKDVSFAYEGEKVLSDVDLEVKPGDFAAFIGSNGAGKTTLLKLMLGLLKPDQGSVKLMGQPVKKFKKWGKIGYISQEVKEFNDSFPATVREIIAANLYGQMGFLKIFKSNLEPKVTKALEKVDMLKYKDRQLGSLSGGQQQRVFIARTLVTDPEIIFLDEPLAGVDVEVQKEFYKLLAKLNKGLGITIVMISHDVHVISSQANKIVCFKEKNIYSHTPEELKETDYIKNLTGGNKIVIDEHEHKKGED